MKLQHAEPTRGGCLPGHQRESSSHHHITAAFPKQRIQSPPRGAVWLIFDGFFHCAGEELEEWLNALISQKGVSGVNCAEAVSVIEKLYSEGKGGKLADR